MMMNIGDLPDDNELAFAYFEQRRRKNLEEYLAYENDRGGDTNTFPEEISYMSDVLGAARALGIAELYDEWREPRMGDSDAPQYVSYFKVAAQSVSTKLYIQSLRRVKLYSVALNAAAKEKLRHLLKQARETIDRMELTEPKKRAIIAKIDALVAEIEQERTRYEAFAALMIEASEDFGGAAKHLEPVIRLIERIGAAIGVAKREEGEQPQLPRPQERKKIESPKRKLIVTRPGLDNDPI